MSPTANLFEIKSASIDVLALLPRSVAVDELTEVLRQRFGNRSVDALSEPFVLDLEALDNPAALDVHALSTHLARIGIRLVGLRHPDPAWSVLAERNGLAWLPAGQTRPGTLPVGQAELPKASVTETAPAVSPMIIDRPVRTGQQIYARGTDLIVTAMVNAGAEIIADGSIHVYAPLRGRALAGARGNTSARIYTRSMEAELVSIAGVYRTIEQTLPDSIRGKSVQIYLENEKIVMSSLGE